MSDWQTIETAPKDGTKILLLVEGVAIEGGWSSKYKEWKVVNVSSHGCGCCAGRNGEPQGWMKLPKPPK